MTIDEQCQIARLLTGSNINNQDIIKQVSLCPKLKKMEACRRIDELLILHDSSFDKAFPTIKNDFENISKRYKLDPSSLFCIYMEWRKCK